MAIDVPALASALARVFPQPKGATTNAFGPTGYCRANGLSPSSYAIDCRGYNAVSVRVLVQGAPGATIAVHGGASPGDAQYELLPDPNAAQHAVNADTIFDVVVGQGWVRISVAGGTFGVGAGYVIEVTPYNAAGQTSLSISATANQNLSQVSGQVLSLGQQLQAASLSVTLASDADILHAAIGDGADTTLGAIADELVPAGATGTISAKLRRVTQALGGSDDPLVAAGAVGTISAKLRRVTQALGGSDDPLVAAGAVGTISAKLRRVTQALGGSDDPLVAAGAVGTISAKLRRVTQALGGSDDPLVAAGAVGTISAKLRRVTQALEDLKTQVQLAASTGTDIGNVGLKAGQTVGVKPFQAPTQIADAVELIGANESVANDNYTKTVTAAFSGTVAGDITGLALIAAVKAGGTGGVIAPVGKLYVFDSDPQTNADDSALAANGAEHKTALAVVDVDVADGDSDANGAAWWQPVRIRHQALANLYVVFRNLSGSAYNDGAGDDEELYLSVWHEARSE